MIIWGLSLALSVRVSVPVRLPMAVGVNVTLIMQLAVGATEPAQLFVWAKSPLEVIVREISVPVPVLVRVTGCEALVVETDCPAKFRLVAERLTTGASPVPLRLTVWGLLMALSVRVSAPDWSPPAVGLKLTLIVQLALAATEGRQLLLWVQPLEIARLVKLRAAGPVFVTVTG